MTLTFAREETPERDERISTTVAPGTANAIRKLDLALVCGAAKA